MSSRSLKNPRATGKILSAKTNCFTLRDPSLCVSDRMSKSERPSPHWIYCSDVMKWSRWQVIFYQQQHQPGHAGFVNPFQHIFNLLMNIGSISLSILHLQMFNYWLAYLCRVMVNIIYSVSQKVPPPKTLCDIFTSPKCISIKFCRFAANLYLHVLTIVGALS